MNILEYEQPIQETLDFQSSNSQLLVVIIGEYLSNPTSGKSIMSTFLVMSVM